MAKTPAGASALFRAAFLVLVLAFILFVIGFSTPNWSEVTASNVLESRSGLWKSCTEVSGVGENCGESIYNDDGWFVIVRTFIIFGLVCFILVMLMSFALLLVVSNQKLARVNIYTSVFTVLFIAIAATTFTSKTKFEHLGYSCWLCWFSVCALVVAIVLLVCAHKKAIRRELILMVSEEPPGNRSYQLQDTISNQPIRDS